MGKIVTFGEIMLRLSPNGYLRFFQNDQLYGTFGGAEANVAVSLANFGEKVSFVSKVPDHAIGKAAIDSLRYHGVDTSYISCGGNRLGIYYLEKGANQRASCCIYDRKGSSFADSLPKDYDWNLIFEDADWFHFTGITPALSQKAFEICKIACSEAKKRQITISCDLNYRSKLWTKKAAQIAMTEICSYVDVCIANEEDAKDVFGIEANNTNINVGKINISGYEEVAKSLVEKFGFQYVAITLRYSHSASSNDWAGILFDGKTFNYSNKYHIANIVDRVGGGDSFGAGLIYALHKSYNSQKAIDFAVAASALKHSIEGDYNRVSVLEIETLANGNASGRIQR